MADGLEGKVVLVTGGASGIGRAAALAFARARAKLVVSDVAMEGAEETARLARAAGSEAEVVRCDVAERREVVALVERAVERFGGLDCAFNNAGIEGAIKPIVDYPPEMVERLIRVNLLGVYWCLQAELPEMAKRGGGAIVNTASAAGLVGAPMLSAYVASKHAVVGLTKVAAIEGAPEKVRVNAVCPGLIQTPMLDRLAREVPGMKEGLLGVVPLGRLGTAEEIGEAVVWLCSPAASYVTGTTLAVDGAFTAH
jgi:NAD(P)-dependent dehydrogenase (short-subunit alcohol dehydrogenase family)